MAEFERAFAERHEVRHALATTSCTTALHLVLAALGIGPDDEVVVAGSLGLDGSPAAPVVLGRMAEAVRQGARRPSVQWAPSRQAMSGSPLDERLRN